MLPFICYLLGGQDLSHPKWMTSGNLYHEQKLYSIYTCIFWLFNSRGGKKDDELQYLLAGGPVLYVAVITSQKGLIVSDYDM